VFFRIGQDGDASVGELVGLPGGGETGGLFGSIGHPATRSSEALSDWQVAPQASPNLQQPVSFPSQKL
jgi:hypothetical protein